MTIYQKLIDNLPKRIAKDILAEFAEPNANATKRWIWELLQNAKDCAFTEGVDVVIQLTDEYIEFSHNGMPFSEEDIIGLLTKDSSKTPDYSDNEKFEFLEKITSGENIENDELQKFLLKTGKFGTGFMTTYLLSKTIYLKTVYKKEDSKFAILEIDLDRDADTLPLMEKKIRTSFEVFNKIENLSKIDFISFKPREFYTTFKYIFNENEIAKKNAESGVQDLLKSIYYTLAFVDIIKSVKLNIREEEKVFKKVSPNLSEGVNIVDIYENSEHLQIVVVSSKYNAYQIAVPILVDEDSTTSFQMFDDKLATQYISFPLVNEDSFKFPVIVNSPLFNPTEARDGLFIESDTDLRDNEIAIKKAKLNKKIYENVIDLYLSLLAYASKNNWQNIHFLAKSSMPNVVDRVWFKEIQQKIRAKILNSEIVQPAKGEISIKPKDTLFPYYEDDKQFEKYWNLCYSMIGDKIPVLGQAEVWQNIIHPNKTEYKSWETDFCFDIEKLVDLVQGENNNLQSTSESFFNGDITETIYKIKEIVQFIEDENLDLLTRHENPYCILPNLEGNYVLKNELYKNKNIPAELIETVKLFGAEYDYSKILVKPEFEEVFISDSEKSNTKISNTVKSAIEKFIKDGKVDTEIKFLSAILRLISYSNKRNLVKQAELHRIALKFYPIDEQNSRSIDVTILNAEDFEWDSANDWLVNHILSKFNGDNGLKDLNSFSLLIFNRDYIPNNDNEVDEFINSIISFVETYYKDLLTKYAIIPNQNNKFCIYNNNIYNDVDDKDEYEREENKENYERRISKDLKNILVNFGQEYDYKNILRHTGVNILLKEQKDTEDICKRLDEVVMKFRDSLDVNIKQAIRDLDNWISKKISKADESEKQKIKQSFGRFFDVRAGVAYNTLSIAEKEQSGKIIHSGYLIQLSKIAEVVDKHDEKSKNILMNSILENLKKEDDKIEQSKFYRSLGKTVEDIFSILIGGEAKVADNGQDFLLMTSLLEIGIRLEIKSRSKNGSYVLMTKKQVETAVNCKEKYVLCVFPDISNSTSDNFKEKSRFVLDIKELLNDRYNETENFIAENLTENDTQNILLEFENKSYKYKINKLVWERTDNAKVQTFNQFEELINEKLK